MENKIKKFSKFVTEQNKPKRILGSEYYFAYGHNTNIEQFHKRIPKAQLIGNAVLPNYRYSLEQYSDIRPDNDSSVHGVLWKIPVGAEPQLDKYEEYYRRIKVNVVVGDKKYKAYAYEMLPKHYDKKKASKDYIDYVKKGYKENNIPVTQINDAIKEKLN